MFGVSIWMLRVTLNCRYAEFVAIFWRPTVAAVVMAAVVRYAVSAINLPVPARFACAVVIGVTTYFTLLTLLWVTAGKPAGAESAIIQSLGRREART
jgi:heme A synthase